MTNISGNISDIGFFNDANNPIPNNNVTISMKEVGYSNFTNSPTGINLESGLTQCFSASQLGFIVGAPTWKTLTLQPSFNHANSNQNLLIETRFNNCGVTATSCPNQNTSNSGHSPGGQWAYLDASYIGHRWAFSSNCNTPPSGNPAPSIEANPAYGDFIPAVKLTIDAAVCTNWSVTPSTQSVPAVSSGNTYDATVGASGNCNYTLTFPDNWIVFDGYGPLNSGIFYYHVLNNPGAARTGYVQVNNVTNNINNIVRLTINQSALQFVNSNFTYFPNPPNFVSSPIYFYDASTGSPAPNNWAWNFGDGGTSIQKDPQHPYSSTGQFLVSLTVKNSNNNTSTSSKIITITTPPAPIANFFSNRNNITPGTTVDFSDDSHYGPSSWQWTFIGGTPGSSNSQNPSSIRYNTPGVYRVKLTVSNTSGIDDETKLGYITVSPNGTNQLVPPPQNAINGQGRQYIHADPIQVGTSTYSYKHNDFVIPVVNGAISFSRFYNSLNGLLNGPLGYGWSHSYYYYIENQQDTIWNVHYPDGHIASFVPLYNAAGVSFPLYSGTLDSLKRNGGNDFTLFSVDNRRYNFSSNGLLNQIIDLNGNTTTLNYNGNRLTNISGPGGRYLALSYNAANKITSVSDPLGRVCNFNYDANGNLQLAYDAKANPTTFTYDASHRILVVKNPLGDTVVNNSYDSQGRLVTQKDAYSQATTFAYNTPATGDATITNPDNSQLIAHHDNFYRKTSVKDELGISETYTYDNNSNENSFTDLNGQIETRQFDKYGNMLVKTEPGNVVTQTNYNSFNSPTKITDPRGNITNLNYDGKNNLVSVQRADNSSEYFSNNSNGLRTNHTDARGNTKTFAYSTNGDLTSTTAPNGTKSKTYDAAGRMITETDERNNTTLITYDNNGNIISLRDPQLKTTVFAYDVNNQLISTTDKKGYKTSFTYDKKGRLKTKTNAKGKTTTYAYDNRDNLISITDPNNNVTSFAYNAKGRKIGMTNALGTTQYQYDGLGNLKKVIDATNKTTDYTHTVNSKISTIKDGLNNTTSFTYDKNGNLLASTNPLGKITSYSYDVMNRLVSVLDADNKTSTIAYDANGNRTSITDPNNHTQTYTYDAVNRLIKHLDASGNATNYGYDASSNNVLITKPTGTIAKTYDIINRVTTVTNSTGNNYVFGYDDNNNTVTMSNGVGTTVMVYDSINNMTRYTDPYNKQVSFVYDGAGNKTSIIYPGNNTVNYTFDNANNLKTVTDWLGKTFTYTYDAAGRNTQLLYPNGIHCDYTFDNAGRLTNKKNVLSVGGIVNGSLFTLDATGNRIMEDRQGPIPSYLLPGSRRYGYANDDRMLTDSIWNFINDNSGNRISETKGTKIASYIFAIDNLLKFMVDTLGIATNFWYDPMGHRLSKVGGSNNLRYVLNTSDELSKVLQITDGNGVTKSQYIYGLGLLERIDSAGSPLYYHYDGQHNTILLTDAVAATKDTYVYDPFGTMLSHTGNTVQPFTLMGEFGVEQENTSLHYVRARYYDAANGRFLSKDEFPFALENPQEINRYVYSINNPLSLFDHNGFYASRDFDNSRNSNFQNALKLNSIYEKYTDNWYYDISVSSWKFTGELYSSIGNALDAGEPFKRSLSSLGKFFKNGGAVLDLADNVSTLIKWNDLNKKYVNGQVSGLYIANEAFSDLYPKAASRVGSVFGPIGSVSAGLVASLSVRIGQSLVNDTYLGNKFTDFLAAKFFK